MIEIEKDGVYCGPMRRRKFRVVRIASSVVFYQTKGVVGVRSISLTAAQTHWEEVIGKRSKGAPVPGEGLGGRVEGTRMDEAGAEVVQRNLDSEGGRP